MKPRGVDLQAMLRRVVEMYPDLQAFNDARMVRAGTAIERGVLALVGALLVYAFGYGFILWRTLVA